MRKQLLLLYRHFFAILNRNFMKVVLLLRKRKLGRESFPLPARVLLSQIIFLRAHKHNKKDSRYKAVLFGEGISFLMGCSKNYIMYWGVLRYLV